MRKEKESKKSREISAFSAAEFPRGLVSTRDFRFIQRESLPRAAVALRMLTLSCAQSTRGTKILAPCDLRVCQRDENKFSSRCGVISASYKDSTDFCFFLAVKFMEISVSFCPAL